MYPYTVPSEAVQFVNMQFDRFKAPKPSHRATDKIIDFVLAHVVKFRHFPTTPSDAVIRFNNPGLTELEKHQILGKLEYELRVAFRLPETEATFNQLHLATWATIMFAWSAKGDQIVDWYKRTVIKENAYAQANSTNRHQRIC